MKWSSFVGVWAGKRMRRSRRPTTIWAKPRLEPLEDRVLPAWQPLLGADPARSVSMSVEEKRADSSMPAAPRGKSMANNWRIAFVKAATFVAVSLAVLCCGCRERDAEKNAPAPGRRAAALAPQPDVDGRGKTGGPAPPRGQGVIATCAAFSPDNKFVLVGFGGGSINPRQLRTALADSLVLWDVQSGKEIRTLEGRAGGVSFVAFFSDGSRAISFGSDGKFRVWDVGSGAQLWRFEPGGEVFRGVASADGESLLAYQGKKLELWNAVEERRLRSAEMSDDIQRMAVSPNGDMAFIGAKSLFLWDVRKWRAIEEFKLTRTGYAVKMSQSIDVMTGLGEPAAFAPDGKLAVLGKYEGEKRYLALWNIVKKQEVRQLGDEALWPAEVSFSDGRKVVCRSREGRLVCWNLEGKQLWETKSPSLRDLRFFVFSKDGKVALAAAYGRLFVRGEQNPVMIDVSESKYSVRVWDLTKGTARALPLPALPEARR